jgi:hypothetical protein
MRPPTSVTFGNHLYVSLLRNLGRHRYLSDLRQARVGERRGVVRTLKSRCGCGRTLPPVEVLDHGTQVVTRTCRDCGQRWQLKVWMVSSQPGVWTNVAVMIRL